MEELEITGRQITGMEGGSNWPRIIPVGIVAVGTIGVEFYS
jgi:hypothetical protein